MRLFRSFDTDADKPQPSSEPVSKPKTNYTFLVVDDSKFSRGILTDILKSEGYTIVGEANDGYEAIDMVREKNPSFVFMDITMPKMDGLTAVKEILKINPDVKIIMCSALSQKRVIVEAIKAGAKDFVIKPYKKENILNVVNIHKEADKKGQVIPFRSENHIKKNKDGRYEMKEENEPLFMDDETLSKEIDLIFDSYEKEANKAQEEQSPKFKVVVPERDGSKSVSGSNSDTTKARPAESSSVNSILDEFERFLQTFSTYSSSIADTEDEVEPETTEDTDPDLNETDTDLPMADSDEISTEAKYEIPYMETYTGYMAEKAADDELPDMMPPDESAEMCSLSDIISGGGSGTDEVSGAIEPYTEEADSAEVPYSSDGIFPTEGSYLGEISADEGQYVDDLSADDEPYTDEVSTGDGFHTSDVSADKEFSENDLLAGESLYTNDVPADERLSTDEALMETSFSAGELPAETELSANTSLVDDKSVIAEVPSDETSLDSTDLPVETTGETEEAVPAMAADAALKTDNEYVVEPEEAEQVDNAAADVYTSLPVDDTDEISDFGLPKKVLPDRPVRTYTNRFESSNQLLELNPAKGVKVNRIAVARLVRNDEADTADTGFDPDLLYAMAAAYISLDSKPGKDEIKWNGLMQISSSKTISSSMLIRRPLAKSISMLDMVRKDRTVKKQGDEAEILMKAISDLVSKKSGRILSGE